MNDRKSSLDQNFLPKVSIENVQADYIDLNESKAYEEHDLKKIILRSSHGRNDSKKVNYIVSKTNVQTERDEMFLYKAPKLGACAFLRVPSMSFCQSAMEKKKDESHCANVVPPKSAAGEAQGNIIAGFEWRNGSHSRSCVLHETIVDVIAKSEALANNL